jgi:8-oxo-dGTP pyrophosphatase MutT (NUDIX family)
LREAPGDGSEVGKYQIPGGGMEPGEDFIESLKREVDEETGLRIKPLTPIMVDGWFAEIKGEKRQIVAIFYLCEADSAQIKLSHEHDDYAWVAPNELSNYEVPHPVPELFKKYEELISRNWGEL